VHDVVEGLRPHSSSQTTPLEDRPDSLHDGTVDTLSHTVRVRLVGRSGLSLDAVLSQELA
jgi:hypothetical protein